MAIIRFKSLEELLHRQPVGVEFPSEKVSDYFAENVFGKKAMRKFLSAEAFESIENAVKSGSTIDRKMAEQIASGMKAWAVSKGATHYTHWFQPLTGATAEKHDAFFEPVDDSNAIERFGGTQLIQQEPDASSFPNGGIRNTFEARGYTAWDPSSPAFIYDKALCIPTIFISYTGESLDHKMPLLKAIHGLNEAAVEVCHYFDKNVTKVYATLGWEQEYFLVDSALYNARPDLLMTGRTVFGHIPAKGQQLEDHYFGSIPERVVAFMKELEIESLKLGIPIKTRHNEVAPNQFECAPIFEELNLAVDHNQLLMDIMEKVARKHNFRILLHEKPFAGVNGSGKHNNWSMATDTGKNLLSPGKTPKTNLMFLTFFVNTIKAVHDYADFLRASIASAGNDHRLGANEAPPAIISIFIGSYLSSVLNQIVDNVKEGKKLTPDEKTSIKLDIGRIPEILLDNTDRNRTSPFAFTGNKFEFRAVGSSANTAWPMTILNTIMAKQLSVFKKDVDKLIEKGIDKDEAILQVLRNYIIASKNILFEGNGYSDEWEKEAKKRGLSNFKTTPEALKVLHSKEAKKLFEEISIFNERELEARYEIQLELYSKKIQIEARSIRDLCFTHVIPTAIQFQTKLIENVTGLKAIFEEEEFKKFSTVQRNKIAEISEHINEVQALLTKMDAAKSKIEKMADSQKIAESFCNDVKILFDSIRFHVDKLELLIDDEMWPLPKYRELLFTK
jgi:glutamine synthetase